MKREISNRIRNFIDERLPPSIRDSRTFNYPMFWYWFEGQHVREAMAFKEFAFDLDDREFREFYERIQCRASRRPTDCNEASLQWVMQRVDESARSLMDIGCGRGYWLNRCRFLDISLFGYDMYLPQANGNFVGIQGDVERLPFADDAFDVVTCFHTLEHCRRLPMAIAELERITAKQLFVIVPKQRYYHHTPDLHLQFFYSPRYLQSLFSNGSSEACEVEGDLVFSATCDTPVEEIDLTAEEHSAPKIAS